MAEQRGVCPFCAHVAAWQISGINVSLPPTGGDYGWAEVDASARCPSCAQQFRVRVRVDLDDFTIDRLIESPFPQSADWRRYVAAKITRHSASLVVVEVFAVAETVAVAEQALNKAGGALQFGHVRRTVLELTQAGYRDLAGNPIQASTGQTIMYDAGGLHQA